ncbi:MAG: hypothetical protein J5736_05595, partial [Bacilli bacterium]|nr:hypothetical protein [Bacilli bacterium]
HQHHLEEGMVLSFPNYAVEVCFYRGFLIEEFPGEASANGEDFLYSIGVKEEYAPLSETYNDLAEDDEEAPIIEVVRPKFTANKKHKILDLGRDDSELIAQAEVDEDENLEIHVERPAFSANSKRKIADLGYAGQPNKPSKKAKIIEKEEEEEEMAPAVSPIAPSAFEARSNKKPKNLDVHPKKKPTPIRKPAPVVDSKEKEVPVFEANKKGKIPNLDERKKPQKPEPPKPQEKKPEPKPDQEVAAPSKKPEPTPIKEPTPIERPVFEARRQGSMRNLHENGNVMNKTIEVEYLGEEKPKRIHEEEAAPAPMEEENAWASIDVFKLKPRVFKGEQAIIASPKDPRVVPFLESAKKTLEGLDSIRISKNCVFVPEVLPKDDPSLGAISHFKLGEWAILALTIDRKEEPIYCLLQNKEADGLCVLVSFKHSGPHLVMYSKHGASVDDRALPYYDYADLKKAVLGE